MASDKPSTRLRELRGSGYEIAKGQPDIRGWDVRDESGRKFGKVQELIFDIKARRVRYMVVNILDVRELELEKRTVLVPIGLAELDSSDDDVILHQVTPFQLRALPKYQKTNLGGKAERDISQVFGRNGALGSSDEDMGDEFYNHEHFNEDNLQRRRSRVIPGSSGSRTAEQEMRDARERLEREKERERELEKVSLRRDAELGQPLSFNDPDDVKRMEKEIRRKEESEEEFQRRIRRR
ncbi:MAG TPA: PRC-barrel domain-containing protein [Flavisolibacter sp.]|nr:PRC-barrel domain-containing protein [Flavisolibacter sp.]